MLLGFLVYCALAVKFAEFDFFQTARSISLLLGRRVVATLALSAFKCNDLTHDTEFQLHPGSGSREDCRLNPGGFDYFTISVTRPEATVRPPSRIAKRWVFSIAIGAISSTLIVTLSPGMTISTPSCSLMMPVTSVVLK